MSVDTPFQMFLQESHQEGILFLAQNSRRQPLTETFVLTKDIVLMASKLLEVQRQPSQISVQHRSQLSPEFSIPFAINSQLSHYRLKG